MTATHEGLGMTTLSDEQMCHLYNSRYCLERTRGVEGGEAERLAMAELRDALLSASKPAAPVQSGEPVAWLVEWQGKGQFSDETWVRSHANELTARDQARANGGTCTPLYAAPQPSQPVEAGETLDTDFLCVDSFAEAMKQKLLEARLKGRSGWQDCDPEDLSRMLREHVEKGDPRDVANFCMMLWHLSQPISAPSAVVLDDGRAASAGNPARGVHALRYIIECLRESGWYRDEEGEDTDALDDLCKLLERTDDPAVDAEEAVALRSFDKSKIAGYSHDLGSYCAGYIDARATSIKPVVADEERAVSDLIDAWDAYVADRSNEQAATLFVLAMNAVREARAASSQYQPVATDERAAFEADYAKIWNAAMKENGWNGDHTADDVKDLREGDTYGEGRDYLNA
ncbi:hypothetical protein NE850_04210 [Paraburkholderia sp. USG1]|uniref:hypothetical protein n=1 Tax=Paraburkholderia sp. USG1 TaxID=2952268 RepID=UPI0028655189|nr:hypothetical protein [Paraburkholderia sp. USG1]MDR8395528.1 hypothetical protein [Paraburkholderia sp. USG1]